MGEGVDWINFVYSMEKIVRSCEHFNEFSCFIKPGNF